MQKTTVWRLMSAMACCATAWGCGTGSTPDEPIRQGTQALTDVHFGVHTAVDGNPDYETYPGHPGCGWKLSLTGVNQLHQNFVNTMTQYASLDFYYNLWNKAYYWEDTGDQASKSLETVDLFFTFTHGQAAPRGAYYGDCGLQSDPADSAVHATWAMWNNQSHARSDHMRLGDEGRGLSVFASYSCETEQWDSYVWTRWHTIFAGGLRMAEGFKADTVWCAPDNCPAQYQHPVNFANYLGAGWLINNAWLLAFDDNDGYSFSPISIASGNSGTDCADRRDHMTMVNFRNYARRRDSSMTVLCSRYWDNAD